MDTSDFKFKTVFVGSVDHGKSSLIGSILIELGHIDEHTLTKLDPKKKNELLDVDDVEKAKGKTHAFDYRDICINGNNMQIVDVPGHKMFVHEMINGASNCQVAYLVVSARRGELEDGIKTEGKRLGQTIEHCLLLNALGVRYINIIVNKMDTIEWSIDQFKKIKKKLKKLCKECQIINKIRNIIPVSAMTMENISNNNSIDHIDWHEGPNLIDSIHNMYCVVRNEDEIYRNRLNEIEMNSDNPDDKERQEIVKVLNIKENEIEVDTIEVNIMYVAKMIISVGLRMNLHTSSGQQSEAEITNIKTKSGLKFHNNKKATTILTELKLDKKIKISSIDRIILRNDICTIGVLHDQN